MLFALKSMCNLVHMVQYFFAVIIKRDIGDPNKSGSQESHQVIIHINSEHRRIIQIHWHIYV